MEVFTACTFGTLASTKTLGLRTAAVRSGVITATYTLSTVIALTMPRTQHGARTTFFTAIAAIKIVAFAFRHESRSHCTLTVPTAAIDTTQFAVCARISGITHTVGTLAGTGIAAASSARHIASMHAVDRIVVAVVLDTVAAAFGVALAMPRTVVACTALYYRIFTETAIGNGGLVSGDIGQLLEAAMLTMLAVKPGQTLAGTTDIHSIALIAQKTRPLVLTEACVWCVDVLADHRLQLLVVDSIAAIGTGRNLAIFTHKRQTIALADSVDQLCPVFTDIHNSVDIGPDKVGDIGISH